MPFLTPAIWRGQKIDPKNPPEEYQRCQIKHLFETWLRRMGSLGDHYKEMDPRVWNDVKERIATWEDEYADRLSELKRDYYRFDASNLNAWMWTTDGRAGGRLTGLDDPKKLKAVWDECKWIDHELGWIEKLVVRHLRERREKGPPENED
jgi:hypothetical protein